MKVNSNITGLYRNKVFKKSLEFASDNGALFSATTMLACSLGVRPLSIWFTPHAEKENKKVACAKSIASSLTGFLVMFGVSKPIANSIKKIDQAPEKYLKASTINNLRDDGETLKKSKAYICLLFCCCLYVLDCLYPSDHRESFDMVVYTGNGLDIVYCPVSSLYVPFQNSIL